VNSNVQDSRSEIAAYVRRYEIGFPVLKDLGNQVADQVGAVRTPEVFVLDGQRVIRYWGRIDDQYGVGYVREKPTVHDLRKAIDELLAGKLVSKPTADSVGCHIGRVREPDESSEVTYSNQIARILQKHCVECHRRGEIGPFELTDYDEVVGWSEMIAEVIRDQRMPPWHANPQHGSFQNERLMTNEEKQHVYDWVASGSPKGDEKHLPEPIEYVTGWRLSSPPDTVIAMRDRPYIVAAEGMIEYQYFVVDAGFAEDKWIRAAEIIPGNRAVVHHAIIFFRAPEESDDDGLGWLTAYVPGQSTFELPSHRARFVPAGSKLVFQMHYTPTGSPREDTTKVGLIFADPADVREEMITLAAINHEFEIPPNASDFPVKASKRNFPPGAKLHAIAPHMHVRGRSFRVEASNASDPNDREVLLDVPQYDFNWQHAYLLREPIPLTNGLRLECTALFDNSEKNLVNPDPSITVRWGDQTWQEMMISFFDVSIPVDPANRALGRGTKKEVTSAQQARAKRAADDLISRFDQDGDGIVQRSETPDAFAAFGFKRFDANKDKAITREEARAAAIRSQVEKADRAGP
jgi:mono/diheme cytochrome c family protein